MKNSAKNRAPITTHILNISTGRAAGAVQVELYHKSGTQWKQMGASQTNSDGRCEDLLEAGILCEQGVYKLVFHTASLFSGATFYPEISVVFEIKNPTEHYHVPLLISPFGYSTYRGT